METIRRAVIDVGTNSVKLLVADVRGRDVQPVHEESKQTRLGKGFYGSNRLQVEAIMRTAEATREFTEIAHDKNAVVVRIIATSAARDAVNADELISAITRASGLKVEIISGEQEAAWVFQGVTAGTEMAHVPLLLLDVGGGSTEFILGEGNRTHFARSFPLGTVRLLEKFPHGDPPTRGEFCACRDWLKHFLQTEVRPELVAAQAHEIAASTGVIQLIGTGGTTSILARIEKKLDRFDREKIERTVLSLEQVVAQRKNLWKLPLEERKEIPGLPKLRADVILTGVLIFETVMEELEFRELHVSTRGLRFAAVMVS